MIDLILSGAAGAIIAWIVHNYAFKCYIEKASLENKPTEAFGKVYFMMTQDQIQKAVKAVYLLEKSYENAKPPGKL